MRDEVAQVIQSTSEIQTIITQISTMQGEVSSSIHGYSATAKQLTNRVTTIAGNCRGSHDKPGVLGMANQLAVMAEELDDVCRKNLTGRLA
jgi:methyl-accepting chemotaxis protein